MTIPESRARVPWPRRDDELRERELPERERLLAAAQELAQLGSWEWDVASNRVTWSDELYRIWGAPSDAGPLTFETYLERVHPEDVERVRSVVAGALERCSAFETVHRILHADGERWIHSRGEVDCEAGEPRIVRGTAQDVTAQHAREAQALDLARARAARSAAEEAAARLQFLADASEQLASSLDYEQTLRTVARLAVPRQADWCAVDILDGNRLRRLAVEHIDPDRVALVKQLQERYPQRDDAAYGAPQVIRTGEPQLVEAVPSSLLEAAAQDAEHLELLRSLQLTSFAVLPLLVQGMAIGALTFAHAESGRRFREADLPLLEDVARRASVAIHNARLVADLSDARVRLEQQAMELEEMMSELEQRNEELRRLTGEANRARAEAEQANAAKSQFLASMSHELRTPLNAIAGYTELLELGVTGAINDEQRAVIARIQRNERRLLGLINDILNFTTLTGSGIEFACEPVDLVPLIAGLEPLIGPQIAQRRINFTAGPLPATLPAFTNAERLEQILLNLLANAIKFTAPGGWVRISSHAEDDGCAVVVVEDSGRGIPSEQQAAIFDPFVQVDPEPARETAGVGLGLAISRELARAMNAGIEVDSEPGRGSRFTVRLPAA